PLPGQAPPFSPFGNRGVSRPKACLRQRTGVGARTIGGALHGGHGSPARHDRRASGVYIYSLHSVVRLVKTNLHRFRHFFPNFSRRRVGPVGRGQSAIRASPEPVRSRRLPTRTNFAGEMEKWCRFVLPFEK